MTSALIDDYNAAEQMALCRLGNRAIEASSTVIFDRIGYPTRVKSMQELWRYADTMHDGRAESHYGRLNGFTEQEFDLVRLSIERGAQTSERLGRRVVPVDAPLMAVISYRLIKLCLNSGTVFELGPGSGYLGTMLQADGFDYRSTDSCQAFFLWQRQLGLDLQVPWWEWYDHTRPFNVKFDVVTANHVLNELHEAALCYFIVRAERMLGEYGFLVAEDFGDQRARSTKETSEIFTNRGWLAHASSYILTPPNSKFDMNVIEHKSEAPMELSKTWDDLVEVWQSMEPGPNPDAEFAEFIGQ
jgi:hypothetical protein